MKDHDRLHMIKKLSFINDDDQKNIFKTYIPDHYNEIYTLYTILSNASIDYLNIDFQEPIEEDKSFIFLSIFESNKDYDKLDSYLYENNYSFKFLRKQPAYNVTMKKDKNFVKITFTQNKD